MSLRRLACLALALALLLSLRAPATLADEESDDGKLVVRLFEVGALTLGAADYVPEVMGLTFPDMVNDEENPLFGTEGEEALLPLGTVDELIEIVKRNVDPVSWQITEGADIRPSGERTLIVKASRKVVAQVALYLAALESDVLATITLEVRAVRVPVGAETAGLGRLLGEDGPSVTLTGLAGQRVAAFSGTQYSYVQDYDVEVAQDAKISDPIVGVANWGLNVSARTVAARGAKRLRTMLDVRLALPTDSRDHVTDETRLVELPTYEFVTARTDLLLTPGEWQVTQGNAPGGRNGGWIFLVRGTASRAPAQDAGRGILLDPTTPADAGSLASRSFDVSDLAEALPNRRGGGRLFLWPSNFTPPEPPELPEPAPILPEESIPDLLRELVVPGSWNRDGTNIEVRYGLLFVTNTARVLDRVEALLAFLRRFHMWSIEMDVRLVDVPTALGRLLVAPTRGAPHLLDETERLVLEEALAEGEAFDADRVHATSLSGARNSLLSGSQFSYLQDYEVEIAEKAVIANPIVRLGTSGVEVDLQPVPTSTGDAVHLAVSVTRTRLTGPIREVSTPHGPLDAPALKVFRVRGNLRVPLGETAVVGAGGEGGRMLVLLVKPVLKPYGR